MQIESPNYTQIPNVLLDNMSDFSASEFKVLMAICRKTFGYHKRRDAISNRQLIKLTGLSSITIQKAIDGLCEHGIITKHVKKATTTVYELNVVDTSKPGGVSATDTPTVSATDTTKESEKEKSK